MKTPKRNQSDVIKRFLEKQNSSLEEICNNKVIRYCEDKPSVSVFTGKRSKPSYHYCFKNEEQREEWIVEQVKYWRQDEERKVQQMAKYEEERKLFQKDQILYSSWGYEQTNIDWYIILERKGEFVTIQQIGSKRTCDENFNDRGDCMPDASVKIGEPFRKKVSKFASITLNSYSWCGLWDGESKGWSSYY